MRELLFPNRKKYMLSLIFDSLYLINQTFSTGYNIKKAETQEKLMGRIEALKPGAWKIVLITLFSGKHSLFKVAIDFKIVPRYVQK